MFIGINSPSMGIHAKIQNTEIILRINIELVSFTALRKAVFHLYMAKVLDMLLYGIQSCIYKKSSFLGFHENFTLKIIVYILHLLRNSFEVPTTVCCLRTWAKHEYNILFGNSWLYHFLKPIILWSKSVIGTQVHFGIYFIDLPLLCSLQIYFQLPSKQFDHIKKFCFGHQIGENSRLA